MMGLGAIDPLEGSLVIMPGVAVAALGATLGMSRHKRLLRIALILVAIGVGAVWGMSFAGGVGGDTGRPLAWLALALPYPVGWILAMIGTVRATVESFRGAVPRTTS